MNREELTDRADLSAYLDGHLSPERAARVERALAADADLRAELKALEATRRLLGDLPRESAPEGLLDAVMERAERQRLLHPSEPAPRSHPFRWIRAVAAAAIIVLTVGLGVHLHHVLSEGDWVSRQEPMADQGPVETGEPLARDLDEPAPAAAPSQPAEPPMPDVAEPPALAARAAPEPRSLRREEVDGGGDRSDRSVAAAARTKDGTIGPAMTDERTPQSAVAEAPGAATSNRRVGRRVIGPVGGRPAAVPPSPPAGTRARSLAEAAEAEYGQRAVPTEVVTVTTADVEGTAAAVKRWLRTRGLSPMVASGEELRRLDTTRLMTRNIYYREDVRADGVEVTFHVNASEAPAIIDGVRAVAAPTSAETIAIGSKVGGTAPVYIRAGEKMEPADAGAAARVYGLGDGVGMHGPARTSGAGGRYAWDSARQAARREPSSEDRTGGSISGKALIDEYLGAADVAAANDPIRAPDDASPHAWLREILRGSPAAAASSQPVATQPAATQPAELMGRLKKVIIRIAPADGQAAASGPASRPASP